MLTIRMQRTGRSGNATFRMIVQDARRTPTSGKVVAYIGSYDSHSKVTKVDKEKATFYVEHGAQPSPRAARLLRAEGLALPEWVKSSESKQGKLRNPEKLRRNQVKEVAVEVTPEPATADVAETPKA
jgi:small subunit ribosomal protein S16